MPGCPGCLQEEYLVWVASFASVTRLGVPCCHVLVGVVGMGIRGVMYSIFDASFSMSSPSRASSFCPLADLLGAMGGECVDLVCLGFVVL